MSDELREYVERVSQKVRLHAAILFGSRALGLGETMSPGAITTSS